MAKIVFSFELHNQCDDFFDERNDLPPIRERCDGQHHPKASQTELLPCGQLSLDLYFSDGFLIVVLRHNTIAIFYLNLLLLRDSLRLGAEVMIERTVASDTSIALSVFVLKVRRCVTGFPFRLQVGDMCVRDDGDKLRVFYYLNGLCAALIRTRNLST